MVSRAHFHPQQLTVQEDLERVNHTLPSRPFLVKSIGITVTMAIIYLAVSTVAIASAQESLSQYMPTAADLNTIRPGWTLDSDSVIAEQSTPYPFMHKSFILKMQWVQDAYPDVITIDISIHCFSSPDAVPKNHDEILMPKAESQTVVSKGALTIGDTSYYVISRDQSWQGVSMLFTKGRYLVFVGVFGNNLNDLYEGQTTDSVPTLTDAENLARIIEAKLPASETVTMTSAASTSEQTQAGNNQKPSSSSSVATTVAEISAIAVTAVALGWFATPFVVDTVWDATLWIWRGVSAVKWFNRINRFGEWINQPRQVRGMGEGGTVDRETGDYAYVTGNRDSVTFVSHEDVENEVNQIKAEIDHSGLPPADQEALKADLEANKFDELAKKRILDAARGSHIGY
jgi:hypothetical protein